MNGKSSSRAPLERRILLLQWVTLGWMVIECSVALTSAWKARSVSLLAFGSDSLVEVVSATVVLLQFAPRFSIPQIRAAKICGLLLYGLAGVITILALFGFIHRVEADTSRLGMAVTTAALLFMPILARMKKDAAERTGNKALRADAVQSATCAYLAALTLGGLAVRSITHLRWIDGAAALAAVPILIVEARRAREGKVCGCC